MLSLAREERAARSTKILELLSKGAGNKEIARELRATPEAVKHYVEDIVRGMGARNRTHAVALHLKEKLCGSSKP